MKVTVFLTVLLCTLGTESLIIPDELPSLLSVIYSNIPTIKKGTDSRLGWGFRLGNRADFQVLVELGPQTYTQPLANQGDKGAGKRNTLNTLANTLYAQNQYNKRLKVQQQKEKKVEKEKKPYNPESKPNIDAAEWLKHWSSFVKQHETLALKPKPGLAIGEIDAKSVLPADDDDEIEKKPIKIALKYSGVPTLKPKTTTSKEDALDNVDLD